MGANLSTLEPKAVEEPVEGGDTDTEEDAAPERATRMPGDIGPHKRELKRRGAVVFEPPSNTYKSNADPQLRKFENLSHYATPSGIKEFGYDKANMDKWPRRSNLDDIIVDEYCIVGTARPTIPRLDLAKISKAAKAKRGKSASVYDEKNECGGSFVVL